MERAALGELGRRLLWEGVSPGSLSERPALSLVLFVWQNYRADSGAETVGVTESVTCLNLRSRDDSDKNTFVWLK